MQTYKDFAPTGFDRAGAFLPERQDWIIAPCGQNRDSQPRDMVNFAAQLERLGGESETVEVHRFGHWANGWFELALVHPSRADEVEAIEADLESYPVLDEDALSEAEHEDAAESWDSWGASYFVRALVRKFRDDEATAELADDLDSDQVHELYRLACDAIGRSTYETHGDGPHFWIDEAAERVQAADVLAASKWHPAEN